MTDPILFAQALLARGSELLDAKAHDYTPDEHDDALWNFRFTGAVLWEWARAWCYILSGGKLFTTWFRRRYR